MQFDNSPEEKKNKIDESLEFVSDAEMEEILRNFDFDKLNSSEFVDMTDWVKNSN